MGNLGDAPTIVIAPQSMQWPAIDDEWREKHRRTHTHAHSDPHHHVGSCDTACRRGLKNHVHEREKRVDQTMGMAIGRKDQMEDDLRMARGLPPLGSMERRYPVGSYLPSVQDIIALRNDEENRARLIEEKRRQRARLFEDAQETDPLEQIKTK